MTMTGHQIFAGHDRTTLPLNVYFLCVNFRTVHNSIAHTEGGDSHAMDNTVNDISKESS
jgi:hypothetical protein